MIKILEYTSEGNIVYGEFFVHDEYIGWAFKHGDSWRFSQSTLDKTKKQAAQFMISTEIKEAKMRIKRLKLLLDELGTNA
jgi:hypothetical protein